MSRPIQPDVEFAGFLAQGAFMLQRSRASGKFVFYPRAIEPGTGNSDLEWVEASGQGSVYSVTVIYPRAPAEPYNVALVDLDEGVRMMTTVDAPSEQVVIGQRVRARVRPIDGTPQIVFEPIGSSADASQPKQATKTDVGGHAPC